MKFPLAHTGRRFFYFTFVAEGRLRALSRLERGAKRPVLTEAGERVREVWAGLHGIDPHFTASDSVIMPDHAHFLLMVNSGGEFRFSPLVFAHWFMAATSDGGLRPPLPPADWAAFYRPPPPQRGGAASPGQYPPPPQHGSAASPGQYPPPPQRGGAASPGQYPPPPQQGSGGAAPVACTPPFSWSRDFWVEVSLDSRQLAAIRRYIRMNPARYFWKLDHPDMFVRRSRFRHPVLDPSLDWTACGDITMLSSPFLFPVRLTMRKTPEEQENEIAACVERARRGGIPVCGFLSPAERAFERRLKELPLSRWIKTVPYALPPRFDPSVEDSLYLSGYRELILSSFTETEAQPFVIRRHLCLAMHERTAVMLTRAAVWNSTGTA